MRTSIVKANKKTEYYRILIVEDDLDMQDILSDALCGKDRTVMRTDSCDEARQAMEHMMPDVVILDLGLKDKNGMFLLNEIMKDDKMRNCKVIIVSAHGSLATRISGLAAGAKRFFTKPVDIDVLVECVNRFIYGIRSNTTPEQGVG